ncbi:MAG: protein-L-isoaspartate(D-aspartate) O-methyltransferase [Nitratireductor sp.]|nr:protein-L-isoaspartate(D-aspartate) O-methyltransferase [Nitratireductor sp.]
MKDRREAIAGMLLRLRAIGLPLELMKAFEAVPRQNFVPVLHLDESYGTGQLPIECGQTMPSPDQIAHTLRELDIEKNHRVLEIGTGTGYQAALLGQLASKVTSLERYRTLVDKALLRISTLGYENITVTLADGMQGQPDQLFDRIIANCAYAELPRFFLDQLTSGGIVIAPVGPVNERQKLMKLVKVGSRFEASSLFEVRMQPFATGVSQAI